MGLSFLWSFFFRFSPLVGIRSALFSYVARL
jgi:hypothetical protein